MRTNANYLDPDNYEIEITITMKSKEWADLAEQQHNIWPSSELHRQVMDVVRNLRRRVGLHDNMENAL